jgi:hypothetical protein
MKRDTRMSDKAHIRAGKCERLALQMQLCFPHKHVLPLLVDDNFRGSGAVRMCAGQYNAVCVLPACSVAVLQRRASLCCDEATMSFLRLYSIVTPLPRSRQFGLKAVSFARRLQARQPMLVQLQLCKY